MTTMTYKSFFVFDIMTLFVPAVLSGVRSYPWSPFLSMIESVLLVEDSVSLFLVYLIPI